MKTLKIVTIKQITSSEKPTVMDRWIVNMDLINNLYFGT
jgi:hypothetical protein